MTSRQRAHAIRSGRLAVLLALVTSLALAGCLVDTTGDTPQEAAAGNVSLALPPGTSIESLKKARVERVIDGDTIDVSLDGSVTRVRYYGIDTPERGEKCYAEATQRNKQLVGKQVILLPDTRNEDRNGRLLRYVFLADGTSVDASLVAEGLARAWTDDGRYKDQIIALQSKAESADRGCLWK